MKKLKSIGKLLYGTQKDLAKKLILYFWDRRNFRREDR